MLQSRLILKESVINWLCLLWMQNKGAVTALYMVSVYYTINYLYNILLTFVLRQCHHLQS